MSIRTKIQEKLETGIITLYKKVNLKYGPFPKLEMFLDDLAYKKGFQIGVRSGGTRKSERNPGLDIRYRLPFLFQEDFVRFNRLVQDHPVDDSTKFRDATSWEPPEHLSNTYAEFLKRHHEEIQEMAKRTKRDLENRVSYRPIA